MQLAKRCSCSVYPALDIRWVENAVFFVTYCEVENPMDTSIFVITRAKDGSVTYAPILDPLMVETMDRPEARFNAWMKNWTPFKHLLLVCNATSNTIGHVGLGPVGEGGSNIAWSCVKNDLYTTLPLETYPLGLEIDYTDTTAPPSDENTGTKPLPLLWSYASDGSLSAWRMVNLQGEQYPSIASPHDIVTQEDAGSVAGAAASSTQIAAAPAPTAATASPFGTASPAAAFGSTTFGSGAFSSPPSFGRPPTFGAPPSFAPAFGQATFGTASAFGKPAFGQPALQPAAAPTKGGFSGFSQQSSAFASPSPSGASSPFASSAASPSPTPAFVSTQPTTFGTSTFGQSGVTSGTASMATSPAPAAFGQSSPFGAAASTTSPFGSTKPASGGFGSFASSSDNKTSSSGFGAFSSTTPASTAGFSFGAATTDPQKNAFGIASPSAFGAIREDTAATPSSAVKPPGLDENDAEDMEPVNTASQQGGAFDFGNDKNSDDGKPANTLSFGGLGFGGDKTAPATKVAPSAFGSFAPPSVQNPATTSSAFSASTSTSASSPFSFKPKTDTSENKPAFGFSGFGQESAGSKPKGDAAPSADTSTPSPVTKPAEGAKGASADAATKVTFGFGTLSPSTEDKKASPATTSPFGGFGSSASFGKTTQFGQASAFGQTSAFGQKSAFGTPSTPSEKPAFAFGKSTSDASVSGGFAGFASPAASTSKSPFASPSTQSSPVTSTFGQPGLFSAKAAQAPAAISESEERKPKDENNLKDSNVPVTESDKVPPQVPTSPLTTSPPAESAGEVVSKPPAETEAKQEDIPSASDNSDHEGDEVEVKQEDLSQDEEWDEEEDEHSEAAEEDFEGQEDEVETDEQEDEEYDEEVEDQTTDAAQPEEQQDNEEVSDDVSDEAKDLGNHSEAADETSRKSGASADESLASEASSEDVSSPPASPSPAPPSSRKPEAATESTTRSSFTPTKSAFSFAPAEDKGSNQAGPATNASWSLGKQGGDEGTPKTANNPFAGLSQAAPDRPTNETPKPDTAKSGSALQSGFAGFGQSAAKTSTSTQGSLPFAAPVKAVDSPKPFGLGNLQKATPRTSSPLASMPAFVPPASPSQTQSSFDLSNLSSAPSSPVTSPSKSSKPLPASTTPQSKAPPPNFFKQPESIPSQKGQSRQQSGALENKVTAEPVVQTPNTPALPTIAPPKLSSTIPKARQAAQVSQDTLNIFITMQDHLDAVSNTKYRFGWIELNCLFAA